MGWFQLIPASRMSHRRVEDDPAFMNGLLSQIDPSGARPFPRRRRLSVRSSVRSAAMLRREPIRVQLPQQICKFGDLVSRGERYRERYRERFTRLGLFARPRMISSRFAGAEGERKSGIVRSSRRGRERNSTGHSVIRRRRTCLYFPGLGSSMYSRCNTSAIGSSAPR